MNEREITIINMQLGFMFDQKLNRPDLFANEILSKMDIFDEIPTVAFVLDQPEFENTAMATLTSLEKDLVYNCNIARKRLDFFMAGKGVQSFEDVFEDFRKQVENITEILLGKKSEIPVIRVGCVARYFVKDKNQDKNFKSLLGSSISNFHNEPDDIYLRVINKIEASGVGRINNMSLFERFSALVAGVSREESGFLLTRDFNSLPEEKILFSKNYIGDFLKISSTEQRIQELLKIIYAEK